MEGAIQAVVKTFLKSSKGKENIGKKDFQNLVSSQLGNILSVREAVNNMTQGLDSDADGKVGFEEYMKLIGYLACSLSEQRVLSKEEPDSHQSTVMPSELYRSLISYVTLYRFLLFFFFLLIILANILAKSE
uniref:S100/CaBP-9k-type calcium binding subdomain domain-containing protein n=1 Tax=Poecilia reticulata TaxID=8081 RepID=A0A3P9Q4K6_POERE